MKLETLKTFILVVLIGISLLLTFGMWNYQPSIESLKDPTPEDISLNGSEESIQSLIEPKQIIFHQASMHYGFDSPLEQREFYQDVQDWVLYDFETVKTEENTNHPDGELIFPTPLPMEILDSLFTFNSSNLELPIWSFQRVYLTLDEEANAVMVEFLSIDGRDKAVAFVHDPSHYEQLQAYMNEQELREYTLFDEGGTDIYLPEGPIHLSRQTRSFSRINPNDLVEVLFSDPSVVRQSNYTNRGTTYFTDSSQMSVTRDEARMEFISPGANNEYQEGLYAEDLLNKSIDDINAHEGWTDEYKLMDIFINENLIRYQMYYQGYPVFSTLTTIEQEWGQRLIQYKRPLFRSNDLLNEITVELPSSGAIVDYVREHYNPDNIMDIQIGYQLNYDKDDNLIVFEPNWYIQQQNQENYYWTPVNPYDEEFTLKGGD
ncbi:YycH family regulatory protein [Oceanobacillus salinisoli]|uniref:YycH family regulatory protein n=1 Tax=Oceanobacillus salinisoli TaxID=2678611 RepID=UPI0012E1068A|nr:two-component system activity regulator YycH [Oceanobacillus salinisoli]